MSDIQPIKNPILRAIVIAFAWLNVVCGVIGIFLPVVPTTPFLLLAAACFIRTSPRFYHWLTSHPKLGKYIVYYLEGKGLPVKAKIYTLVTMWFTMSVSMYIAPIIWVKVAPPLIGALVTVYILRLPTVQLKPEPETQEVDPANRNGQ